MVTELSVTGFGEIAAVDDVGNEVILIGFSGVIGDLGTRTGAAFGTKTSSGFGFNAASGFGFRTVNGFDSSFGSGFDIVANSSVIDFVDCCPAVEPCVDIV